MAWTCILSSTCSTANNASLKGTSGFNTQSCVCNSGFIRSVSVNASGSLVWACTCPTNWTIQTGTAGNACCPPNATINTTTNTCSCNFFASTPYYMAGNST